MKQASSEKSRKNGYQSDDDNVRYKLNRDFFDTTAKSTAKVTKKQDVKVQDDDNIRYKFPKSPLKPKVERKSKPKPKIKVNFWSNKTTISRLNKPEISKENNNRRHTVGGEIAVTSKAKNPVKVRKRVSFLPSPIFSDDHVPMVTVPDDLTIQLNEEEANDIGEDLNLAFVNSESEKSNDSSKPKTRTSSVKSGPQKRKRNSEDTDPRSQGNEYEFEFFSKYVVQKLRRMETNQRIYSENLINTVLMLGQLGKLNGKSKILEP